jgi:hypothetical protein
MAAAEFRIPAAAVSGAAASLPINLPAALSVIALFAAFSASAASSMTLPKARRSHFSAQGARKNHGETGFEHGTTWPTPQHRMPRKGRLAFP